MAKIIKTISERTKESLAGGEGQLCDYKRSLAKKGLETSDIVAFANSRTGGAILIGVDEEETQEGVQRGRVVGCDVSDAAIQIIENKVSEIQPSLKVEITIENIDEQPLIRIDVPSGENKPYRTARGLYVVRVGRRKNALGREELLDIFLNTEQESFFRAYNKATKLLEERIDGLVGFVDMSTQETLSELEVAVEGIKDEVSALHNYDDRDLSNEQIWQEIVINQENIKQSNSMAYFCFKLMETYASGGDLEKTLKNLKEKYLMEEVAFAKAFKTEMSDQLWDKALHKSYKTLMNKRLFFSLSFEEYKKFIEDGV